MAFLLGELCCGTLIHSLADATVIEFSKDVECEGIFIGEKHYMSLLMMQCCLHVMHPAAGDAVIR